MTEEEQLRDLIERYGAYLDEYNEPWQGINPRPKYYVVPKETPPPPQEEPPTGPSESPVETPAEEPVRVPVKVSPRPVRKQPARVTIRLRAKKTPKTVTVTVKAKKKNSVKVTPKKISKE